MTRLRFFYPQHFIAWIPIKAQIKVHYQQQMKQSRKDWLAINAWVLGTAGTVWSPQHLSGLRDLRAIVTFWDSLSGGVAPSLIFPTCAICLVNVICFVLRFGARTYLDTNLAQSDLIQYILSLTSNLWPSPLCTDLLLNLLISLFQVSNKSEGKADYL